jgi:hypothetical protein
VIKLKISKENIGNYRPFYLHSFLFVKARNFKLTFPSLHLVANMSIKYQKKDTGNLESKGAPPGTYLISSTRNLSTWSPGS